MKSVPYTEWHALVEQVTHDGIRGSAYNQITNYEPISASPAYTQMICKDVARLETYFLTELTKQFQHVMNECLEEYDKELAYKAYRIVKQWGEACMSFWNMKELPYEFKHKIEKEITANLSMFEQEWKHYLNHLVAENQNQFIEELIYLDKKRNLVEIVLECKKDA